MMETRIYLVTSIGSPTEEPRLVRASNQAQALRHIARKRYSVGVADQNDLIAAVTAGIKVEEAGQP